MLSQNLINFEKRGKIEKISPNLENVLNRFDIVAKRLKTARMLLTNNNNDEGVYSTVYSELYSSFRILSEIMLEICGYRVKFSSLGHHEAAINSIYITLDDSDMQNTYSRLKNISKKRKELEYGRAFNISSSEMETMLNDVSLVKERVEEEVDKFTKRQKLI